MTAFKKIFAYTILILFLYIFSDFLGLFLLTFIFAYLFSSIAKFIKMKFVFLAGKYRYFKFLIKTPFWFIVLVEYLIFVGMIIVFISSIIPTITNEIKDIQKDFGVDRVIEVEEIIEGEYIEEETKSGAKNIIENIEGLRNDILGELIKIDPEDNLELRDKIANFETNLDFSKITSTILESLKILGSSIGKIIIALILSFIFIIDRKKLSKYLYQIKESNMGFFYKEYYLLLEKVVKSFGLILKAQSMIALINSLLTVIGLFIIGLVFSTSEISVFPYLLTLGLVVFIFGFIPVLGVILSSIPIIFVAYATYLNPMIIIAILLLITIVHIIESYYLNPKIVSKFLELPVSLTFIILLVSEHFFGLAGLLIGISLFYFLVGLLKDFNKVLGKKNKKSLQKNKIK